MNLLESFEKIKAFVFDMDGVLTDGTVMVMPGGEWVRTMHIRDGYALQLAIKKGFQVCVISGSSSEPVRERLARLGVHDVFMNIPDKVQCLRQYMESKGLDRDAVLYMGDDIPDLEVSSLAGLSCCPSDAAIDMREIAHYISPYAGGWGCVREVIEKAMRVQGQWTNHTGLRSL
jgi:3-deoxy-D-manno-octulosonate 8-phosphate phosphatase (KDO 8-P phosphatase)